MPVERIKEEYILNGRERLLCEEYSDVIESHLVFIPILSIGGFQYGFTCDGGTIPKPAWSIVGHPFDDLFFAYLRHDYRWAFRHLFPGMTFGDSNDLLYLDCVAYKASPVRAGAIYQAVKRFGKPIWERGKARVGDLDYHYEKINCCRCPLVC